MAASPWPSSSSQKSWTSIDIWILSGIAAFCISDSSFCAGFLRRLRIVLFTLHVVQYLRITAALCKQLEHLVFVCSYCFGESAELVLHRFLLFWNFPGSSFAWWLLLITWAVVSDQQNDAWDNMGFCCCCMFFDRRQQLAESFQILCRRIHSGYNLHPWCAHLSINSSFAALFIDNVKGKVTPPQPKANCINKVRLEIILACGHYCNSSTAHSGTQRHVCQRHCPALFVPK